MAKYTINYSCGHGSLEKQLYGKESERQRYIKWAEDNMVCSDCYKAKKQAEDANAEKVALIEMIPDINPVIAIVLKGQIAANKRALYNLGYRWDDEPDGLMGMLSIKRPTRALMLIKQIKSLGQVESVTKWLATECGKVAALGYQAKDAMSALDYGYLRQVFADLKAREDKAGPAPVRPIWYASLLTPRGATWNGKIYGAKGSKRIYISNVEHKISDAQAGELEQYQTARAAYRKAMGG